MAKVLTNHKALIQQYSGIILVGAGALFENLLGPTPVGWGLLLLGVAQQRFSTRHFFRRLPFTAPLIALACLAIVSLFYTTDRVVSQTAVNQLIVNSALLYSVTNWLLVYKDDTLYHWALIGFGVLFALAAPFIIEWQQYKIGIIPNAFYDVLPTLLSDPVHPNIMASLMLLLFPLPLLLFLHHLPEKRPFPTFIYAASAFLMLIILFLTRSRAGYAIGGVGMVIILWLMAWRRMAMLLVLAGCIMGAVLLLGQSGGNTAVSNLSDPSTFAFRLTVWQLALDVLRDFPFTGVGMTQFNPVAERLYPYPPMASPGAHNLYLQIAVDLGLIALFAFLWLFGGTLWQGWQKWQQDKHSDWLLLGCLLGLTLLALHGLVDATMWGTRIAIAPWLLLPPVLAKGSG